MKETERMSQNELKKMRRMSYIKMVAIVGFVVAVMAFGSIAWFTMNREVEGSGVRMTSSDLPFEIRTVGDNVGPRNHIITVEDGERTDETSDLYSKNSAYSGINAFIKGVMVNNQGYYTDGTNSKIQWHLTGTEDEKGLGPDSEGKLTFYIIPKQDGPLNVHFSLDLEGYTAVQSKNDNETYNVTSLAKVTDSSDQKQQSAVENLNSHILFFKDVIGSGTKNDPFYYKDLISNKNDFTLSFPRGGNYETQVKEGVPIEVNFYWKWANTFGQMVFSASENSNKQPVFANVDTRDAIRQYLVDNYTKVFVQSTDSNAIDIDLALRKPARDDNNQIVYFFNDTAILGSNTLFEGLSLGYNTADQDIGTNLNYTLIVMTAGE